jgi:hypothetical protein
MYQPPTNNHNTSLLEPIKTELKAHNASADAIKFTVDQAALSIPAPNAEPVTIEQRQAEIACSLDNPDACESCSG